MKEMTELRLLQLIVMIWALLLVLPSPALPQRTGREIQQIRLSGGEGPHEGNIEVKVGGTWGFVCDDEFGFNEADAVCRDLGHSHAQTFTRNNHFGINSPAWRRSSVRFWLDRVNCSTSSSFRDCSSRGLGQHDCGPTEVAGVVCRLDSSRCNPEQFPCLMSSTCLSRDLVCDGTPDCSDASDEAEGLCKDVGVTKLRSNTATNVPGAGVGVVFVKHNGEWGTVCDDSFLTNDAKVVCRSLGYSAGWIVPFTRSYLGQGKGKIWVDDPGCTGAEEWIGQCPSTVFGRTDCSHTEDVSVFCYDGGLEVRLVDGPSQMAGRVEARLGSEWGSICGTRFDDLDARVVCKMLGYNGDAQGNTQAGRASGPMWQVHLDCLGHEDHLQQCRIRLGNTTCRPTDTAAVICSHTAGKLDEALKSIQPENCGQVEDSTKHFLTRLAKVRGGVIPSRFDAPWLVSLRTQTQGGLLCGGSIISEYYVVTAAHCLRILGHLNLVVRVGDHNSNFREEYEEEYFIDKLWQHEDFDVLSFDDNDIALLKVEPKNGHGIRFGPRVKPLCLPRVRDQYQDLEDCTVIGWGRTVSNGTVQARPSEGQVKILGDHECEQVFTGGTKNFSSSFVCAGNLPRAVNSCQGDSGGPMTCRIKGRNEKSLYGVVSIGFSCRPGRAPDNLTRVTKYLRWIYNKISGSS